MRRSFAHKLPIGQKGVIPLEEGQLENDVLQIRQGNPQTLHQNGQEIRGGDIGRLDPTAARRGERKAQVDLQGRKMQQVVETLLFLQGLRGDVGVERLFDLLEVLQE